MPRKITDHRARPIELYGVQNELPFKDSPEGVPRAARRRIDDRLRGPLKLVDWTTSGVNTLACLILCLSMVPVLLQSGISVWVWAPLLLVANVLVTVAIALSRRWLFHRGYGTKIIAAFLAEQRCPACGYDLGASAPAEDGCTVCPECGAGWKVNVR